MRVLLIEDNREYAEELALALRSLKIVEVELAFNAESGRKRLAQDIDYVILDLALPIDDDGSPDVAHGASVFEFVRVNYPGTPVLILTGHSSSLFAQQLIDAPCLGELWGFRPAKNIIALRNKDQTARVVSDISTAAKLLADVDPAIEIHGKQQAQLNSAQLRVLRCFANQRGSRELRVQRLDSGVSGAVVLKIDVLGQQRRVRETCVGKLAEPVVIARENENYEQEVVRLPFGVAPGLVCRVSTGAGAQQGVFFSLAREFSRDAFTAMQVNGAGTAVSRAVKQALLPWHGDCVVRQGMVRDIRRTYVSDEELEAIRQSLRLGELSDIEQLALQFTESTVHGDLHGANVLVDAEHNVAVIDYGDVTVAPTVLDPITFDLSVLFHPSRSGVRQMSPEQLAVWFDLEQYAAAHPMREMVVEIRHWLEESLFGEREIAAGVYAYALRQARYEDTDKELVVALLRSAIGQLRASA